MGYDTQLGNFVFGGGQEFVEALSQSSCQKSGSSSWLCPTKGFFNSHIIDTKEYFLLPGVGLGVDGRSLAAPSLNASVPLSVRRKTKKAGAVRQLCANMSTKTDSQIAGFHCSFCSKRSMCRLKIHHIIMFLDDVSISKLELFITLSHNWF